MASASSVGTALLALSILLAPSARAPVTELASIATEGAPSNDDSDIRGISGDGRYVAFDTGAANLVEDDPPAFYDAFVHDRDTAGSASLCKAGSAGVISCPCSNPP